LIYCGKANTSSQQFDRSIITFESDEYHTAHAKTLEEEGKLIESGFEYVRYAEGDAVAIYRKR
jgi:hypothetical protein